MGVCVGVGVSVGRSVGVGVRVGVSVRVGVRVTLGVFVGVEVTVGVYVGGTQSGWGISEHPSALSHVGLHGILAPQVST